MTFSVGRIKSIMKYVRSVPLSPSCFSLLFPFPDDPAAFKDAPIAIQVTGRTLEEEAVIAMGEIVDAALKSNLKICN